MAERQSTAPLRDVRRFSRRTRGAAIMLALWALFLLSAMIISWALDINTKVTNSGYANRSLEAVAMASSGVDVAMHPAVEPGWPILRGSLAAGQSYETRITGESGRLNLNWIAAFIISGQDQGGLHRELLRKYLEIKGIDLNERDHMIDCLIDWIDPDNVVQLNGAEDEEGYKAANKPLGTLEELKQVRGWEELTSQPDWEADFTLYTPVNDARIDVRWASRDVLLAVPGMTEGVVDRFIALRRGQDEIEGTEDDVRFNDPRDPPISFALGMTEAQFNQLGTVLAPAAQANQAQVLRIVSLGKSGAVTRTVRVVVTKTGNNLLLKAGTWKEF